MFGVVNIKKLVLPDEITRHVYSHLFTVSVEYRQIFASILR